MFRRNFVLPVVALILSMLTTTSAMAVGQRTFVASYGDDLNPCTLQLPCRAFPAAVLQTNPGGEVIVLDSAGYGPVTITKAVSIIAPLGVYAGMSPTAGVDGIVVAAGPSDKVVLRGLTINGQGGNRGILVTSAGEVYIEQCTVTNMTQSGIQINGGTHIHIRSSAALSNQGAGLYVNAVATAAYVVDSQFTRNQMNGVELGAGTLHASRINANDNGLSGVLGFPVAPGSTASATISDSVMSGNAQAGAYVQTNAVGVTARMAVVRSTASRNYIGFGSYTTGGSGFAFIAVSDSTAVENSIGLGTENPNATAMVTRSTLAGNSIVDAYQSASAVLRTSGNNTLTTGSNHSGAYSPNTPF